MAQQQSPQFDKFKSVLRGLFMLDHAELDFGIYRIMNQKRRDIDAWLTNRLRDKVRQVLRQNQSATVADKEAELQKAITQARDLGVDPETSLKVKHLREEIAAMGSPGDFENEVYSHLATFFSRYYDEGDFISQRRYKRDVYAIPYEGEEVKLHWANADQYYIKTAEYFRNYSFRLPSGKTVEFALREAATEQNNNKAQGDQRRLFALYEPNPETEPEGKSVETDGNTLRIWFTYQLYPKSTKQKDLAQRAYDVAKGLEPIKEFAEALAPRPTEKDKNRTLLQKHITDYVARNQFDYFIHKDLRRFLTRELDFYVKNEMLFIDDIDAQRGEQFLAFLAVVKAVKTIGGEIIGFLASIEDYQKRLWEKRKFVTQADYCITLDHIAPEFYTEICANESQRKEWVRLFAIDKIEKDLHHDGYSEPLTEKFLTENKFLPVDTALFTPDFRRQLLATIDDIDSKTNGLLINSENFQALRLLQEEYAGQVKCIYIDPPYNTGSDGFTYKDGYQHSTWLAMMRDRLTLAKQRLSDDGVIFISIDDNEQARLKMLCDEVFGEENFVAVINWKRSGGRQDSKHYAIIHEYILCYSRNYEKFSAGEEIKNGETFPCYDETQKRYYKLQLLRKWGSNSLRENRPNLYYSITGPDGSDIYPMIYQNGVNGAPLNEIQGRWRWGASTMAKASQEGRIEFKKNKQGKWVAYEKIFAPKKGDEHTKKYTTWIDDESNGTDGLKAMFGNVPFDYSKSFGLVQRFVEMSGMSEDSTVLDFFAGSGTTGHAVINMNRDGGNRKYILVEMGDYFDTVTKPRVLKAAYSKEWKDGAPVGRDGVSQIVKYVRLEQYEDTLNNLVVQRPGEIPSARFEETRLLGYMLDTETRDSLFNLKWFGNPFDVHLCITRAGETRERQIDMVETFNYLIGLSVDSIAWPKDGLCTLTGRTRRGEKTLVIWRDVKKVDSEALNDFFTRSDYSTRDREFDVIYVNGDNQLENVRQESDTWKVRFTEETFQKKMFGEA